MKLKLDCQETAARMTITFFFVLLFCSFYSYYTKPVCKPNFIPLHGLYQGWLCVPGYVP